MKNTLTQVLTKIENDYNDIQKEYQAKTKRQIIQDAYRLAHYNEVADFFDYIEVDDYEDETDLPFSITAFENIAKFTGNAIKQIVDSFMDYSHPERYNFFEYECLLDIIEYAFTRGNKQ